MLTRLLLCSFGGCWHNGLETSVLPRVQSPCNFLVVLRSALGYMENSRKVLIPVFFCLQEALQLPALSIGICKVAGN